MKRVYRYLIPAACALALVFSLGFFFGRRSVPYEVSVDAQRPAVIEPAAQMQPQAPAPAQDEAQSAPVEPDTPDAPDAPDAPQAGPVNINTATKEELMTLPGVGEVLAQRIIEYRETYGRFVAPEQLMDVSGIGEQRFADLAELITVGE